MELRSMSDTALLCVVRKYLEKWWSCDCERLLTKLHTNYRSLWPWPLTFCDIAVNFNCEYMTAHVVQKWNS
jgi:hypothetical protein